MAISGRTTVYNKIVTDSKVEKINKENITLMNDFLDYLQSIDRSKETIKSYHHDLLLFFCWALENNDNKFFVDMNKREFARFQNWGLNLGWSPNRVRRVKSTLSSLSNFIYNMCDDIYEDYKPVVRRIESPVKENVREKSVFTDDEVNELLDKLVEKKKYRQACAVALAVFSGARKKELTRFKVEYFNDENIIFDAMWKTSEKIRTKGRGGKLGKPLYKYTLLDFKPYLDLWMNERKEKGIESEWLFVSGDEEIGYAQAKTSTMDSYAKTISDFTDKPFYFHSLRHQLCSRLCRSNLPQDIIKEYFGWSSTQLIDTYNDNEATDDFGKYFTADGIQEQEKKGFADVKSDNNFSSGKF